MNLSVIIPNFNGEKLLETNLPKVLKAISYYKQGKTEIIVVDDASTDDSISVIKKFPEIKLYVNSKNLGFSSTVNTGVRNALGDIIILLNTDVYPENNFLEPLLKHFENDKVFAVGCLDKSIENSQIIERGRGLGEWKRGLLIHRRGEIDKSNTLWVSCGSGAFRKKTWENLGGLNQLYNPFYWEDIDLSYRALKSGYEILFEAKSIVFHEHDKGAIKSKYSPSEIKTIAYRNQFIFIKENATDFDLIIKHLLWLPYHITKAILSRDLPFIIGYFKSLVLLPKVIKSSMIYQKNFVKKDKDVIKNYLE